MLPHYVGADVVEEEERDQTEIRYGKCKKGFVEMDHDNYMKMKDFVEDVITRVEEKVELFDDFFEKHFFTSYNLLPINGQKRILYCKRI